MRSNWLWLVLIVAFAACGKKTPPVVTPPEIRTVTVEVPVPVKAQPPAELLTAQTFPLPIFIAPSDPGASSALTAEGERLLRGLIEELLAKLRAWEAWAKEP